MYSKFGDTFAVSRIHAYQEIFFLTCALYLNQNNIKQIETGNILPFPLLLLPMLTSHKTILLNHDNHDCHKMFLSIHSQQYPWILWGGYLGLFQYSPILHVTRNFHCVTHLTRYGYHLTHYQVLFYQKLGQEKSTCQFTHTIIHNPPEDYQTVL